MFEWEPKTKLGTLVKNGEITTMSQALATRLPFKEPEIVDILLPNLENVRLKQVKRVQRMTDSGRRVKLIVCIVVGNRNGFVGLGIEKGDEMVHVVKKGLAHAKLNIIEILRGCGSWECGCGKPHSTPYKVIGKCDAVSVELRPAPKGVGIVAAESVKPLLELAGIKDVWVFSKGSTKTTYNFVKGVFNALNNISMYRVSHTLYEKLRIRCGEYKEDEHAAEST